MKKVKLLSVAQMIVLAYLVLIIMGGLLLMLPIASKTGVWTAWDDALFTATSALCVTGQVTLNTSEHWNRLGQVIIIALIELGGLGFMTLWVSVFKFTRRQPNLKDRLIARDFLSVPSSYNLSSLVYYILEFAILTQALGAAVLATQFVPEYGWTTGMFYAVFHSISAFCNAGFDLFGDSLIGYQANTVVMLTIAALIMAGGLGYIVWQELFSYFKTRKLSPYVKIVLWTTGTLWLLAFMFFATLEWHQPDFSHLSWYDRLINCFFLSVTPRTAGYSNIDYAHLQTGSIMLTFILMFIGASSGSTGGGIKVTTLAIVLMNLVSTVKRRPPVLYYRRITPSHVQTASFIILVAGILVILSGLILSMTEVIPPGAGMEYILIEVISCLGTVGLSLGLTPQLSLIGKLVLILLMFIGRIGLVTFFWSFSTAKNDSHLNYPEIKIMIG